MPIGVGYQSSEARPVDVVFPFQKEALRKGLGTLDPDKLDRLPQFDTSEFPSFNELQGSSLTGLENLSQQLTMGVGNQAENIAAAQEALNQILSGASGGVSPGFEDFFRETVYDPSIQQFQEGFLEDTSRGAARTGNIYGSDTARFESRGREDLIDSLTRERARLGYEDSVGRQQRALQALGLAPGIAGAEQAAQEQYFDAGERARAVEQAEYEATYAEFNRMMDEIFRRLGLFMQGSTATTRGIGQFSEGFNFGF